jgi:hypothetical protein
MRQLDPMDTLRLHLNGRTYLEAMLAKAFDGITIVMTHHARVCEAARISSSMIR